MMTLDPEESLSAWEGGRAVLIYPVAPIFLIEVTTMANRFLVLTSYIQTLGLAESDSYAPEMGRL